jgi:CRP/FNR family transcriptional regulator
MDSKAAVKKLEGFFAVGKEHHFSRRAVILDYAEETDKAYWIVTGSVTIVTCNRDGNERIQHIYEKGEVFPIKWIFENEQFDIAFFAFTDVVVRTRPITDFRNFLMAEPEAMLPIIHQQVVIMESLINLNIDSVEQRIACRLMTLARRYGVPEACDAVRCSLSVQELASTARASREITGKILNKFEREGLVKLERRSVTVFPERLKQVAEA